MDSDMAAVNNIRNKQLKKLSDKSGSTNNGVGKG